MALKRRGTSVSFEDAIQIPVADETLPEFSLREIFNCPVDRLAPSKELLGIQKMMEISTTDRETLKHDIKESGAIRDPIKAYRSGNSFLILGGYNRWLIAKELKWNHVPVEVVNLDQEHRKNLVVDDNLSRRQLSDEQRTMLLAIRYPQYFEPKSEDLWKRKKMGETVSPISAEKIAKSAGLTSRTIKNYKANYQQAKEHARAEGRKDAVIEDLVKIREDKNAERRAKEKTKKPETKALPPENKKTMKAASASSSKLDNLISERNQLKEDLRNITVETTTGNSEIRIRCKNDNHLLHVLAELEKHLPVIIKTSKQKYIDHCSQSIKMLESKIKEIKNGV